MKRIRLPFLAMAASLVLYGLMSFGQDVSFVYVESFRKGSSRVTESTAEVVLDAQNQSCRIRVKDESGKERYEFGCFPQRAGLGDDRIVSWQVRLADLHHKIYTDVLRPSVDAAEDSTQVGWLDPGKSAKIPITRERVVKVDRFFCILQVKDVHFVNPDQPHLDHVTLDVRFTNSMPHTQIIPKEEKTGV